MLKLSVLDPNVKNKNLKFKFSLIIYNDKGLAFRMMFN